MRKAGNRLIKIGLCDDIIGFNKKMENHLERYGEENHLEVKISSYGSGSQIRYVIYDVIIVIWARNLIKE